MLLEVNEKKAIVKYLQSIVSFQDIVGLGPIYSELNDFPLDSRDEDSIVQFYDFIDKNNLVALVGLAGSGKTYTLKQLEYNVAKKYIIHKEGLIPLFISALSIESEKLRSCGFFIQEIVNKGIPETLAKKLFHNGQIIFIIDALDEIDSEEHKLQFDVAVLTLINKYPLCKLVLSSRSRADFEFIDKKYSLFSLSGLNQYEIDTFVEKYLKRHEINADIKNAVTESINSYNVDLTNPLRLNMSLNVALSYKNISGFFQKNSNVQTYYREASFFEEKSEVGIDFLKITDEVSFKKTVEQHMVLINQLHALISENDNIKQYIGDLIKMANQENYFQYKLPLINLILSQMNAHFSSVEKKDHNHKLFLIEAMLAIIVGIITIYSFFF